MHTHSATKNKLKSNFIILMLLAFTALIGWLYYQYTGSSTAIITAVSFGAVYALISYFTASKIALKVNRAKPISKKDFPQVYRIVEELTKEAKLPMPKLYIVNDPAANAFATGRSPEHAHVAVTSGVLEVLNEDELKAVLSHEISHVKNYDIRLMMVVFACITSLNLIIDFFLRSIIFGDDERGGFLSYILISIISSFVGLMIQAAISRQREYAADLSGSELTKNPKQLASALRKISTKGSNLKVQSSATAHLFLDNPLRGSRLAKLFSTHPPMEQRIKVLESL
ncbi:MAG: heat shock protein HtpX [Patescibacteria group bacterium]|nr:heat shock protein HtpX [Patescibacteria group bacterium]